MKKYVMALDQGTTSSRCILFDQKGRICSVSQKEFKQEYPKSGWVEHDPMMILSTQVNVAKKAMEKLGIDVGQIDSIGITNQRETTIVWNKHTGQPIYNAIVWQCRRTSNYIDELTKSGFDKIIKEKTGLIPDAYFSATKIKWILDNVEGARREAEEGNLLFGTVDTWLIWNLTRDEIHTTDYTNASRTMLFDINKLDWDEEILSRLDIPRKMLPELKPSSCIFGHTDKEIFGREIPIAGVAGDQQAALFGQCGFGPGDVKNTYGTGCFLLMNTGVDPIKSEHGLLTTIAANQEGEDIQYVLEGSIFAAGATIQWLRDELEIIKTAAETDSIASLVGDSNGVYVVPAFTGLGAPYWDQYARGLIIGLTRGVNRKHLVRAALESIAYQTYDVIKAMEHDSGIEIRDLKVDGGASANNFLMQFQSDILNTGIKRPYCIETTALGAAYLAGLATGYWKDKDDIKENWELSYAFEPKMNDTKRQESIRGWKMAVARSLNWEE
ncbi:MAG TPA: glycerol kinase GlpK [Clostridiales bacterium]|nr:glycerol kinase GlpK [Clostridiales bacterium]